MLFTHSNLCFLTYIIRRVKKYSRHFLNWQRPPNIPHSTINAKRRLIINNYSRKHWLVHIINSWKYLFLYPKQAKWQARGINKININTNNINEFWLVFAFHFAYLHSAIMIFVLIFQWFVFISLKNFNPTLNINK